MDQTISTLAERFRRLGCRDPESWARSEVEEGIAQFGRFVFLQQLWKLVIAKNDRRVLNRFAGPNDDHRGGALRRIKDSGVNLDDLITIIREAQIDVVREVANLLDQTGDLGPDLQDVKWGLFELDSEYKPNRPLEGLHESVDDDSFIHQFD